MKLVDMICPNCSAHLKMNLDKGKVICEYCGKTILIDDEVQHIQYDNAEDAGYKFEKGRQRAKSEARRDENGYSKRTIREQPKKKRRTWLWILGWICVFPLPLTILLLQKKNLVPAMKYGAIAAAWILYLVIGLFGSTGKKDDDEKIIDRGNITAEAIENSKDDDIAAMNGISQITAADTTEKSEVDAEKTAAMSNIEELPEEKEIDILSEDYIEKTDSSDIVMSETDNDLGLVSITENENDSMLISETYADLTVSEDIIGEKAFAITAVNVREQPNTSCEKLGQLTIGTEILRYEAMDDGWSRVSYNGRDAYVKSEFLATESEYALIIQKQSEETAAVVANTDVITRNAGSNIGNATASQINYGSYIVNVKNGKIHRSSCSYLPDENNRRYFDSLEEVMAAGFSNYCQKCMKQ